MPWWIPGDGAKINAPVVVGAVAPNTDPAAAARIDTWECTLAGVPVGGDSPQINIGLTYYAYGMQAAIQDIWEITIGGAYAPGDTVRLTIPGGAGTPYDYVVLGGDTDGDVAAGLAAAAAANGLYTPTSLGAVVTLSQVTPGTGAAVTSAFLAGAGTAIADNTQVGAPITPYATVATAIAAAITADTLNNGYTAFAVGPVVTVTANAAGAPTKAVSSEFSPPSGGSGTFVAVNTIPGTNAGIPSGAGLSLGGSIATTGTAACVLVAGTSYDVEIWYRDVSNVWTQDTLGPQTIVGDINLPLTIPASAMRAYAFVDNFVGVGAEADVTITTNN